MDDAITKSVIYKKINNSQLIRILVAVDKQLTNNLISGEITTR